MIYLVTNNPDIHYDFTVIDVETSLFLLQDLTVVGLDTETSGLEVHTKQLLTVQLGNKNIQVVIDCTTVDIKRYKEYLESDRLFIAHNLKFDYKWFLKEGIVIRNTYDTFITEKVLTLGLNTGYSLQKVADKYLGVYIDKSVRGDISIYGLNKDVILYAANDVVYLEDIMLKQEKEYKDRNQEFAVKLENAFTPVLAYIEFCGMLLDVEKWKYKMSLDKEKLDTAKKKLDEWVIDYCKKTNNFPMDTFGKYGYPPNVYAVQSQPLLFEELEDEKERCVLNWNSSTQLIPFFEELGFNVWTKDKETGLPKKSVDSRLLSLQKDKSDIVPLLLEYSSANKQVTSFGQNYIDAINPVTGRIHPEFNQLISSGRMSCGKGNSDSEDIVKDKSINVQQLPNDHLTRECFIAQKGYKIIASDYSDQEGHQFANLTGDKAWIDFYNDTSGRDGHSFVAKMIFKEELEGVEEKDVKKLRPDLRQKAKAPRFTFNYRGTPKALQANTGLPIEECEKMFENYFSSFPGIKDYFASQEKKMWDNGYIQICEFSNMRSYIPSYPILKWLDDNKNNIPNVWDLYKEGKYLFSKKPYKINKKDIIKRIGLLKEGHSLTEVAYSSGIEPALCLFEMFKVLFKTKASYGNKSANMPSQGSSAHMTKTAFINYYKSLIERGLVFKCLIINGVHDECLTEVPMEMAEQEAAILRKCMEDASRFFCRNVFIKAVPEIGDYWIH